MGLTIALSFSICCLVSPVFDGLLFPFSTVMAKCLRWFSREVIGARLLHLLIHALFQLDPRYASLSLSPLCSTSDGMDCANTVLQFRLHLCKRIENPHRAVVRKPASARV